MIPVAFLVLMFMWLPLFSSYFVLPPHPPQRPCMLACSLSFPDAMLLLRGEGILRLRRFKHHDDPRPLDPTCDCFACQVCAWWSPFLHSSFPLPFQFITLSFAASNVLRVAVWWSPVPLPQSVVPARGADWCFGLCVLHLQNHTRAYIHHLLKASEPTGMVCETNCPPQSSSEIATFFRC